MKREELYICIYINVPLLREEHQQLTDHEGRDGKTFFLLQVTLLVKLCKETVEPRFGHVHRSSLVGNVRYFDQDHAKLDRWYTKERKQSIITYIYINCFCGYNSALYSAQTIFLN